MVAAAVVAGAAVIVATVAAAAATGDPVGMFTRDVTALAAEAGGELPPYAGAISLLNLMAWASVASLSLLVAWLRGRHRGWLAALAAATLFMAADDSLTLHERVGPALGIPEVAFLLVYGLVGIYLTYGTIGARTNRGTLPFLIGGALLAGSVLVDYAMVGQYLFEDGLKLLGTFVWLTVPVLCLHGSGHRRELERHPLRDVQRAGAASPG